MKSIRLKKDFVIKAGTVFLTCDGESVEYNNGNYSTTIGVGKDSVMDIVIDENCVDMDSETFEILK